MAKLISSSLHRNPPSSTPSIIWLFVFLLCLNSAPASSATDGNELSKGVQLTKQGKYREALMILRSGPENATNYYYQAYCHYQLHDAQNARTLFQIVASKYARSKEAQFASRFLKQLEASQPYTATQDEPPPDSAILAAMSGQSRYSDSYTSEETNERENRNALPDEGKFYFTPGDHGHMNVQATINGRPINCWFDTGAPGLFFSVDQLKQLGIALPPGPPNTHVSGWAGRKVPAWDMNLTVRLGSITRNLNAKVQAAEYDLQPLIGYSFVQGYDYQIDQAGRCVYMKKAGINTASAEINSLYDVPCKIVHTKPVVPIEVNGKKVPVFVDTGSNSTNFDLATIQALGIQIPPDAPIASAAGVGGSLTYRIIYVDLRMGPIIKKEFPVQVGGAAGSCVGQDFLAGKRYTIDESKGLLRFFH